MDDSLKQAQSAAAAVRDKRTRASQEALLSLIEEQAATIAELQAQAAVRAQELLRLGAEQGEEKVWGSLDPDEEAQPEPVAAQSFRVPPADPERVEAAAPVRDSEPAQPAEPAAGSRRSVAASTSEPEGEAMRVGAYEVTDCKKCLKKQAKIAAQGPRKDGRPYTFADRLCGACARRSLYSYRARSRAERGNGS